MARPMHAFYCALVQKNIWETVRQMHRGLTKWTAGLKTAEQQGMHSKFFGQKVFMCCTFTLQRACVLLASNPNVLFFEACLKKTKPVLVLPNRFLAVFCKCAIADQQQTVMDRVHNSHNPVNSPCAQIILAAAVYRYNHNETDTIDKMLTSCNLKHIYSA